MWTRLARGIAVTAGLGLLVGGLAGCGNDTRDRRYCVEVATERRVDDRFCEPDNNPAYAWVWVQQNSHRPGYGYAAHYPTYRYPINTRGQRVDDRAHRASTSAPSTQPRTRGDDPSSQPSHFPTYPRTQQTSGPQDPAPTTRRTTRSDSGSTTRRTDTGSKSKSGSSGSKSGSKSGGSSRRR